MDGLDFYGHASDAKRYSEVAAFYDMHLLGPLWEYVKTNPDLAVVMTADHRSDLIRGGHLQDDTVPFLVFAPSISPRHETNSVFENNMVAGIIARLLGLTKR